MNALGQEARALIDSVSTHDDPSGSDKARVRTRLAAQLGAAAFATLVSASATDAALASASKAASSAATKSTAGSLLAKLALAGAALGVVVGALWLSAGNEHADVPRAQDVESPAKAILAPVSTPASTAPNADEAPVGAAAESVRANAEPSADRASVRARKQSEAKTEAQVAQPAEARAEGSLGRELKLLSAAQAALRAGAPERALVLADEHRASFPEGVMKEERLGIEALAGCALGRDYRAQAEAFLRVAENSPLRMRVQKACGIAP